VIRALAVGAALVAGALATGCGGDGGGEGGAATQPGEGASATPIVIRSPADGKALRARVAKDGLLRLRARVRGRARAGSTVFLSAACRPRPCEARAKTGSGGRWAASLTLTAPRSGGFVTIDANAQDGVVAAGSAVATVELYATRPVASRSATPRARARSSAPARRPQRTATAPARRTLPHDVLVVGDSLATGIADALPAALPGWRVRIDAKIGRPLAEGMRILGAQGDAPAILAFSLFTNDDPRNTSALEAAVRSTASRAGGCAVWATVVRPPLNGVAYAAANQLLQSLALDPKLEPRLRLVDWSAEVAQSPSLIAGDGVHATPAGYRVLAQLYAAAIRSCAEG